MSSSASFGRAAPRPSRACGSRSGGRLLHCRRWRCVRGCGRGRVSGTRGSGLCFRGRGSSSTRTEFPFTVDNTRIFRRKIVEKAFGEVKTSVWASRALSTTRQQMRDKDSHGSWTCLVHDFSLSRLSTVRDGNGLETITTTTVLLRNNRSNIYPSNQQKRSYIRVQSHDLFARRNEKSVNTNR